MRRLGRMLRLDGDLGCLFLDLGKISCAESESVLDKIVTVLVRCI